MCQNLSKYNNDDTCIRMNVFKDMLFELDTTCIDDCPAEYMSVNDNGTMRCVRCDGPCEQGKIQ